MNFKKSVKYISIFIAVFGFVMFFSTAKASAASIRISANVDVGGYCWKVTGPATYTGCGGAFGFVWGGTYSFSLTQTPSGYSFSGLSGSNNPAYAGDISWTANFTKNQPPPINGGWSGWSSWSACSVTACGSTGTQTRTRTCTNPTPANGGANCSGSSSESQACSTAACPVPTVDSFTASPSSIAYGGSSTLSWTSSNATSCTTNEQSLGTSGSLGVGPLYSTRTYNITCRRGDVISASRAVTVSVGPAPTNGGWSGWSEWSACSVTACGSSGTQTRTRTCTNPTPANGGANCSGSNTETQACSTAACPVPPPTINSFTASPSSIAYGGSSTLSWSSSNATSCTTNEQSLGTSGSLGVGPLYSTRTYNITCRRGDVISASRSVTVSVGAPPTPTVSFTASPSSIAYGGSSTLSWSSSNATSCNVLEQSRGTSGSLGVGPLYSTKTYGIICSGVGDTTVSKSVTVSVGVAPTVDLKCGGSNTSVTVPYGGSTNISWTSGGVSNCTVSPSGWTGTSNSGISTGSLTSTRTYTIVCQ